MATFLSQLADYQYIFFYLNALTVEDKLNIHFNNPQEN